MSAINQEVPLLFVDLKKAHDNVPLNKLWEALETRTIKIMMIKSIEEMSKNSNFDMKIGKKLSNGVYTNKGLKQRCYSPKLLKIFLEKTLRHFKHKCNMGISRYIEMVYPSTPCFADRQVTIAQTLDDLKYMTRELIEEYSIQGLEVKISKPDYMCVGLL